MKDIILVGGIGVRLYLATFVVFKTINFHSVYEATRGFWV